MTKQHPPVHIEAEFWLADADGGDEANARPPSRLIKSATMRILDMVTPIWIRGVQRHHHCHSPESHNIWASMLARNAMLSQNRRIFAPLSCTPGCSACNQRGINHITRAPCCFGSGAFRRARWTSTETVRMQ